jgi:hypothetical protein
MPFTAPLLAGTVPLGVGTASPAVTTVDPDDATDSLVQSGAVGVLGTTETFWNSIEDDGILGDESGNPTGVSTPVCTVVATGPVAAGTGPGLLSARGFPHRSPRRQSGRPRHQRAHRGQLPRSGLRWLERRAPSVCRRRAACRGTASSGRL